MSIELYFSNQLEQLGQRLSENLSGECRTNDNIFQPSKVIAHNNNLKKWIQMNSARNLGISINMEFKFLENGLWDMLKMLSIDGKIVEIVNNDIRLFLLIDFLQKIDERCMELSPLHKYLYINGTKKKPDYCRRIWQLASKLSFYFREYEFHRPDMITRWLRDGCGDDDTLDKMEICQRYIYNALFHQANGWSADINGTQYMTLSQYAYKVFGEVENCFNTGSSYKDPVSVHIFGLSQVSNFHQYLIARLGGYFNIHVYAFNPCCEFWEDAETKHESKWKAMKRVDNLRISKDESESGELKEADNHLLQWWGKPGRENIRLLSELTDYNFYELFCLNSDVDICNDSVLQRLQRNILFRTPSGDGKYFPVEQDTSLQIAACSGIIREVETVYNSIIYNMKNESSLKLTDIAILVPNMDKYKASIVSVFSRRPTFIPFNLCDSTANNESIFGKGVMGILNLADGSFNRKEVFSLISNPCFMDKFSLTNRDVKVWVRWADELNIFYGYDGNDRKRYGYSAEDLHTWKQGLIRLRLARVMDAPVNVSETGVFGEYKGVVPIELSGTDDLSLMEQFCEVIELLFSKVRPLKDAKLSCCEWADRIGLLLDALLSVPDGYAAEKRVCRSLLDGLNSFRICDDLVDKTVMSDSVNNRDVSITLPMVMEFITSRLTSISSGYGSYLTGGVTIAEIQPMRPIPFKIVYVMGMGEGQFPGKANQSTMDLRLLKRRIGDINRAEADCYMFLEILVSTRDKLYISFVSRDLQRAEVFVPCSVIYQLKEYVEAEILPDKALKMIDIPLDGSDMIYLDNGVNSISDLLVNYSVADRIAYFAANGLLNKVKDGLDEELLNKFKKFEPNFGIDAGEIEDDRLNVTERIQLRHLKRFIEDPAGSALKKHLGIYEEDDRDKSLLENEPFFSRFPFNYDIEISPLKYCAYASAVSSKAVRQQDISTFLNNYYRYCSLSGLTPEGSFKELDKVGIHKVIADRFSGLMEIVKQIDDAMSCYQWAFIGDGSYVDAVKRGNSKFLQLDPVIIETGGMINGLKTKQIELHGSIPMLWRDDEGWNSLVLTTRTKSGGKKLPEKYVLEPFLFYLTLLADRCHSDIISNSSFTIHIIYKEEIISWRYKVSKELAKDYISALISDYLDCFSFDMIHFETVSKVLSSMLKSINEFHGIDKESFVEKLRTEVEKEENISDLVKLSGAVVPEDAFDIVYNRFSLLFSAEIVKV